MFVFQESPYKGAVADNTGVSLGKIKPTPQETFNLSVNSVSSTVNSLGQSLRPEKINEWKTKYLQGNTDNLVQELSKLAAKAASRTGGVTEFFVKSGVLDSQRELSEQAVGLLAAYMQLNRRDALPDNLARIVDEANQAGKQQPAQKAGTVSKAELYMKAVKTAKNVVEGGGYQENIENALTAYKNDLTAETDSKGNKNFTRAKISQKVSKVREKFGELSLGGFYIAPEILEALAKVFGGEEKSSILSYLEFREFVNDRTFAVQAEGQKNPHISNAEMGELYSFYLKLNVDDGLRSRDKNGRTESSEKTEKAARYWVANMFQHKKFSIGQRDNDTPPICKFYDAFTGEKMEALLKLTWAVEKNSSLKTAVNKQLRVGGVFGVFERGERHWGVNPNKVLGVVLAIRTNEEINEMAKKMLPVDLYKAIIGKDPFAKQGDMGSLVGRGN